MFSNDRKIIKWIFMYNNNEKKKIVVLWNDSIDSFSPKYLEFILPLCFPHTLQKFHRK